jgi:RNA polymerase sigma-70 factor (ECF subfamily)
MNRLGAMSARRRAVVGRALRQLSQEERDALVVTYYGGCTYREAAVLLGQPEAAVKTHIRSGLRRLGVAFKIA